MRFAVLAAVVCVACWRSSPPPPPPPPAQAPAPAVRRAPPPSEVDQLFRAFEGFADDMCRCTDMVCAQRVSEEMTQWSHEQENGEYRKALKLSEDDNRRAAALAERMTKCMQDAMMNSQAGSAAPTP